MRRPLAAALAAASFLAAHAALAEGPPPPPYYYLAPPEIPPPPVIRWNEGELIPFGYHKGKRAHRGLLIAGTIVFSAAWVPSTIIAFADPFMAIPIGGPFAVASGAGGNNFGGGGSGGSGVFQFWLVFDGLQQAVGVALFIAAFAAPETVLLRDGPKTAKPWWLPVPVPLGPKAAGLGIAGTM